jgi:hypothetical protein
MADITHHDPIPLRRMKLPSLPELRIGATLCAMATALGRALEMAYVAPFDSVARRSPPAGDADLQGRDPNW